MRVVSRLVLGLGLCVGALGLVLGCKSTEETEQAEASSSTPGAVQPGLTPPSSSIRTIQLYQGGDEQSLPVTSMGRGDGLTLEFDLLAEEGRPLSIYFQHADRTWRRDLSPGQFLESFQDDRLVDYRPSRGTDISYVHYRYRFPNDDIRFRVSGNYVLRVTERGRRDSVLFEQPFFVTEEEGGLQLGAEGLPVPGQQQPSLRPRARFAPPSAIRGNPFGHAVCFVRNGRFADTRCKDRPLLVRQPELEFELGRERAYDPATAEYGLDLSTLRPTAQVARVKRTSRPIQVVLDPDHARFAEALRGPSLNGQTVVRNALSAQADPSITAEYVETTFAFVPPDETPYGSPPVVAGSFSGMDPAQGTPMDWNAEQGRYEGRVLLKQGRHQYFYATSGPGLTKEVRRTQLRRTSTYTAFVYYRDPQYNTDRLLRVGGFRP
ncbi:type IX secretion system plug protein domain-containing protein [Salinibacter altiplanensis]|uniref:type IX secretion system plug protein n=1 Tax=Salinibacter altiplanensis TaxID=1803181 RepID=UPI000C9FE1CC|nr:type IX secretion system plug protein domain-containing protein [Salinibacter altiplanensis]